MTAITCLPRYLIWYKATKIVHFPVHGTIFYKIKTTFAIEYPLLLTSNNIRLTTNIEKLSVYFNKRHREDVLYQAPTGILSHLVFFAISKYVRIADTDR